jgi:hypothetical protein
MKGKSAFARRSTIMIDQLCEALSFVGNYVSRIAKGCYLDFCEKLEFRLIELGAAAQLKAPKGNLKLDPLFGAGRIGAIHQ